jgi:hypothetical protein
VFDRGTADALNIRIGNAGHRSGMVALMGKDRTVQFEYVELSLPGLGPDDCWTADVAFIKQPDFQMPFQGLLGAAGFLDRHIVTFNYYEGYFDIARP